MAFVGSTENTVTDEVFDAAFNEALDTTPPADDKGAGGDDNDDSGGSELSAGGDDGGAADSGDYSGVAGGSTTPPASSAADSDGDGSNNTPPATPPVDALQTQIDQLLRENAALKAPAAPAPVAPAGPTPEEVQAKADEDKAWADFKVDWPEVAAMMEKKQLSTEAQLSQALAVVKQLTDQVTPLAAAQTQSDDEKFVQTILTTHKDASTLLPEVEKWILTLPRHRQVGANFVLDRGSAQDVVALYSEFKVETGRVVNEPPPTPSGTQTQPVADKADKLRKMEAVSSRRTSHQEPPDSTDFDGAFNEAINSNTI